MRVRDADGLVLVADAHETQRIDAHAIETFQMPSRMLMELAGQRAADAILERTAALRGSALVLCGPGNNGGDGYVLARRLFDAGWSVTCLALYPPSARCPAARANHDLFVRLGGKVMQAATLSKNELLLLLASSPLIVDALFGTGLNRELSDIIQSLVDAVNACEDTYTVALDLPTGLCANTGAELGRALCADLTLTFGLSKPGLRLYPGADLAGEVITLSVGWPTASVHSVAPHWRECDGRAVARCIPERHPSGHKGSYGHVAVIGGLGGKSGAAVLSAQGALRTGAGLVTWYRDEDHDEVTRPPELMTQRLSAPIGAGHSCIIIGPGLGRSPMAAEVLKRGLNYQAPAVIDADALNLLAPMKAPPPGGPYVLTPHPAEAARLLGVTTQEVQANRPKALSALVNASHSVVVLKGACTLIGGPDQPSTMVAGACPALSIGGSGDVLAGVIAGLIAQGLTPYKAAYAGAWLHLTCAQRLGSARAQRGVTPSEVAAEIPRLMHELVVGWHK